MKSNVSVAQMIRVAVDYEVAANRFLDIYETRMKAAGAALFEAYKLALREATGKEITDEKALAHYKAPRASRSWWYKHLTAEHVTRPWVKRTLQWHLDPARALVHRAKKRQRARVYAYEQRQSALVEVRQHLRSASKVSMSREIRLLTAASRMVPEAQRSLAADLIRATTRELQRLCGIGAPSAPVTGEAHHKEAA